MERVACSAYLAEIELVVEGDSMFGQRLLVPMVIRSLSLGPPVRARSERRMTIPMANRALQHRAQSQQRRLVQPSAYELNADQQKLRTDPCPIAAEICTREVPPFVDVTPGRESPCRFAVRI
jgi:hypothetical protein